MRDLQRIGSEKRQVHHQQQTGDKDNRRPTPFPLSSGDDGHQQGGRDHGAGDGDAVRGGQIAGRPKEDHQADGADEHQG